jgi:hypothetical protein
MARPTAIGTTAPTSGGKPTFPTVFSATLKFSGPALRNPNDPGFDGQPDPSFDGCYFWLSKLNQFNGNFMQAEMVEAFLASIEYRQRFARENHFLSLLSVPLRSQR